jgi:hypothetical protein
MMITNQRKLMDRVGELIADGYLIRGLPSGTTILTMKGLEVLMAAADRPTTKLTKESLEVEREISRKRAAER